MIVSSLCANIEIIFRFSKSKCGIVGGKPRKRFQNSRFVAFLPFLSIFFANKFLYLKKFAYFCSRIVNVFRSE